METKQKAFLGVSTCAVQVCRHLTLIILDMVMVRSIYIRSHNSENSRSGVRFKLNLYKLEKPEKQNGRLLLAALADTR